MQIKLLDGTPLDLPDESTAADLAKHLGLTSPSQGLAADINGTTVDLLTPLQDGDTVSIWNFNDPEGQEIFWHTSAHVLAQAVLRLYPDAKPTIGPPIESGFYYDFANLTISEEDLSKIEKEMKKVASENYKSKRQVFPSKDAALQSFVHNEYKQRLIEDIPEGEPLSAYTQGEFFDLCRGPHLPSLGKIKALKVLKTSGAYWKGDSKNEMLTRIYAISFPDRAQLLEYIKRVEEAKKRDHKIIGPKLDLFSLKEEAPGMPFIHPRGMSVWKELLGFMGEMLDADDYIEIKTPTMMTRELWEKSGHWGNYRENMFTSEVEDRDFAIKPMNCPGCMLYFKTAAHSYRELPMRVAEIGNVHRFEPSGALSGLMRCRSFHQDDAHIFMRPIHIKDEILGVLKFADTLYKTFGLEYHLELSTKPDKNTIGSDEEWETATEGLRSALEAWGAPYKLNEGDGAFYGPKIDFHIRDALGRTWQCGTIQLDMALPEKFNLEYTDASGEKKRPIMIHRAMFGSIERFFGILIEHFAGRFPLWISPSQVRFLPVADRHIEFAERTAKKLKKAGFRVEIDTSHESVGKKVRAAQLMQVNYMITIGDKELESQNLSLRTRDGQLFHDVDLNAFLDKIVEERDNRRLESPYL